MSNLEQETGDPPLHTQETELEILKRLAPMITSLVVLDVGASTGVFASYFAFWKVWQQRTNKRRDESG